MHPRNPTAGADSKGTPAARVSELENSLIAIRQARDSALSRAAELTLQLSRYEDRLSELADKLKASEAERGLVAQRDANTRADRDALQLKLLELNGDKIALLERERMLQTKVENAEGVISDVSMQRDQIASELTKLREDQDRFRAQQKRSIAELADRFASSQKSLDGALATIRTLQATIESQKAQIVSYEEQLATPSSLMIQPDVSRQQAFGTSLATPELSETESTVDIGTPMAGVVAAIQLLGNAPESSELLQSLETNLNILERRARQACYPALHRHVWSIVEVTRWLRSFPKKAADSVPVLLESAGILPELSSVPSHFHSELDPSSARVFAVDDDMDNCECIAMALEKLQISTAYETNPERALAELIREPRDLIVLDVDMPGLDGIGLYQCLRSQAGDIPVIFLSGLSSTEARLRELPPGNFAFVSKPYNLASLALTTSTMLLRSRLSKLEQSQTLGLRPEPPIGSPSPN